MSRPEKPQIPEVLDTEASAPESLRPPTYYNEYVVRFVIGACIGGLIDVFLIRYQTVLSAYELIDRPLAPYVLIALPLALAFTLMVWSDWDLGG